MANRAIIVLLLLFFTSFAAPKKGHRTVNLKSADVIQSGTLYEDDMLQQVRVLKGNVYMIDKEMGIKCDSAIQFLESKKIKFFGKVRIKSDSVRIRSTNGGVYLIEDKHLFLDKDIRLEDDSVYAESDEMYHYEKEKKSILLGSVFLEEKRGYILCDSLIYYKNDDLAKLKQNIIVVRDTDNVVIYGDSMNVRTKKKESIIFSKTGKDVKFVKVDNGKDKEKNGKTDTLYILSRRMNSFEKTKEDTVERIEIIDNVRLMQGDLSCISKKGIYLTQQKKITLTGDVVMWKEDVQASGDSVIIYLKKNSNNFDVDRINIIGKAFFLSKDTLDKKGKRYNQSEGKQGTLYFWDSSKLRRIDIINQAKMVYHLYDDKKPKGATKITGDTARFYFKNKEIEEFEVVGGVIGEQYPEKQVRGVPVRLDGFKDRFAEKPMKPKPRANISKKGRTTTNDGS